MPTYPVNTEPGVNIETTTVFELPAIDNVDINSAQFKDFMTKLRNAVNKISVILNMKDTGLYVLTEFACGKAYFPDPNTEHSNNNFPVRRNVFRKTFIWTRVGGLLIGNTTIAHNLNINPVAESIWSFTDIYGTANDITNRVYFPIPYVDPVGNNICLSVDALNININSIIARPAITLIYITLEYLKY